MFIVVEKRFINIFGWFSTFFIGLFGAIRAPEWCVLSVKVGRKNLKLT